jgi:hypothetical protein
MAANQQFIINQPHIASVLSWIREGKIAIPEIQRPFVWEASKVRNLLDSLLRGYPVGFLIGWKNPDVQLKDGSHAGGKIVLIDGQQRVTALMAALDGREVVSKHYRKHHIRIAYHPLNRQFEVMNSAIAKDAAWIPDVSVLFAPGAGLFKIATEYLSKNPTADPEQVHESLSALLGIQGAQIGFIELAETLDIETVTEIFIRVNSEGVPLNQADFAMSKIAVNDTYDGNALRKAIDYFCHLSVTPNFFDIMKNDTDFGRSDYLKKIAWLKNENENLYDPSYTDILRVAFTSEFGRGRLADLVALLAGRNFETKKYEEIIVEESFNKLHRGVQQYINENNFKNLIMILRSAGFVDPSMIGSSNAVNFAYILFLLLKKRGVPAGLVQQTVRRWFVMSLLTGRHSGSFETRFEQDARALLEADQALDYVEQVFQGALSDTFWEVVLPRSLVSSSGNNQFFHLYKAAQVKLNDRGFLSSDFTVKDLVTVKSDVHHIFPRDFLKRHGIPQSQYNQIANYVIAQSEINIAIGNKEPAVYLQEMESQVHGGPVKYGSITDPEQRRENLRMNCIPEGATSMRLDDYPAFLSERRQLMAVKIRTYFQSL